MSIVNALRGTQVELYVRSLGTHGSGRAKESLVERLERLQELGAIDGFTTRVWGDRIALTGPMARTDAAASLNATVATFEEWATESDASLVGFGRRTVDSSITEAHHEVVVLPSVTLAEYREGALTQVSPCRTGDACRTVDDRLGELERAVEDEGTEASEDEASERPESESARRTPTF